LVLLAVKIPILQKALQTTAQGRPLQSQLNLDNFEATNSETQGRRDILTSDCMFVQAFKQLHEHAPEAFRVVIDSDRCFRIKLRDEDGIDAGGVYREGLQRICEDLFSDRLNLMLPTPNTRLSQGAAQGCYMPNPRFAHPKAPERAQQMFALVGQLMGLSLRYRQSLPFQFPPIVWKALVGLAPDDSDLDYIDAGFARQLRALRSCERRTVERDGGLLESNALFCASDVDFQRLFPGLTFSVVLGDGSTVAELIPDGSTAPVRLETYKSFASLATTARLAESAAAIAMMRRGFASVVPLRAVRFFTW
jgi:hypothetical protein